MSAKNSNEQIKDFELNYSSDLAQKVRPNLFIIGAMKAGTTSLQKYLNTHPDVFMCEPKEPCYFVHPRELSWPKIEKLKLWKDEERYLALFQKSQNAKIIGEASTAYTKFPLVTNIPERIYQFNPEARFIYVLRDPIERTISHYLHEVRQGNEYNDMLTAIMKQPLYGSVSNYENQLRQFLNYFDLDQFFIFTFEEMIENTLESVKRIFDWLSIDGSFSPPNLEQKSHTTPDKFYLKSKFYRMRYSFPLNKIANLLPTKVRKVGLKTLVKEVDRSVELAQKEAVIEYLQPIQRSQVEQLSSLIHRDFPEWKTLSGTNN
ncbi:MAG: sulfotransferase [Leptolyngbyaceae cyanobacterium SM1_1_3]|nr:sulfotransferase [Leptolyngbyaceae cyanobacterium SM1_1_3]NJN01311.1 sulfotransferase [Leptolyngbyaceae cyanobacterium RM1_1_2]NJO09927.1 sulfotransferase [Leptolyngbyaceae cyanobacterium SL_1_1]